jgi:two-component system sensor kinase FixL
MQAAEASTVAPANSWREMASIIRDRRAMAYGGALTGCAAMGLLTLLLEQAAPGLPVFLLLLAVVLPAGVLGGLGPGLLATVVGLAVGLALTPVSPVAPYVFAVIGFVAAVGGERLLQVRRRGEEAMRVLAEREAQLRLIFDSAPDAMLVIDERGIVQTYSAAAQHMFGWTADEVVGRNVSMLMPEPYRREHDGYINRYLTTGEKRIIGLGRIVVGERKGGASFPIELSVGELNSAHGRFFTGFIRDLSERQAVESRLQELQSELIHISRLTALGEMASSLAHELNQPLSAIANYLSGARWLLEAQNLPLDARAMEAIAKSGEQALRAGEIIRRLRGFLARGDGERSIEPLAKLVHEACSLALVGAKENGVHVRYQLDPAADRVVVDRVPIQQVIVNLVRNALDAMADHDGKRELTVATGIDGRDMARVSVIDTGPGLDEAVAERLFQPFMTTKAHGMGVGLPISRTIVEAHGGRIWTEPNPVGGAIFHFTLRLAREEGQQGP